MCSAAGAVGIAGAAILTINARGRYTIYVIKMMPQQTRSYLYIFPMLRKKKVVQGGGVAREIKPNAHDIAACSLTTVALTLS